MAGSSGWRGIVADIERCATARGRASTGCCWVEGRRLHERALRAGRRIRAVVTTPGFAADGDPRTAALRAALAAAGVRLETAPPAAIRRLTAGRAPDIVGLVELPVTLPPEALAARPGPLLVAWEVEDPGNVGALARTALAASAAGLLTVGHGDLFHPRAVRTSRGAVFKLAHGRLPREAPFAALAPRSTVGAVTRGGVAPDRIDLPAAACAIVVGGEAFGLPDPVVEGLDRRVTIPMSTEADSYSVNAAAAILLWAARSWPGGAP